MKYCIVTDQIKVIGQTYGSRNYVSMGKFASSSEYVDVIFVHLRYIAEQPKSANFDAFRQRLDDCLNRGSRLILFTTGTEGICRISSFFPGERVYVLRDLVNIIDNYSGSVARLLSLLDRPKPDHSAALLILCQAYLFAHYSTVSKGWHLDKALQRAEFHQLRDLGLTHLVDQSTIIARAGRTEELEWWEPLRLGSVQELLDQLQREVNIVASTSLRQFVEKLLMDGGPMDDVELVAQVYLEVVAALKLSGPE